MKAMADNVLNDSSSHI